MEKLIAVFKADFEKLRAYQEEDTTPKQKAYREKLMAIFGANRNETTAWNEGTKIEPDPRLMPSPEEHQEIPTEDTAVMLVGELRKRRRVRYLAAESLKKRKDRTRGNHGSRRKSPAACRKVSHHAKVAWRKGELFRKSGTQENCGPRKELTAAGMRKSPEGNDGIRCRDVKEPPHLKKKRRMTNDIKGWRAGQ
jgi:hypothetical protein